MSIWASFLNQWTQGALWLMVTGHTTQLQLHYPTFRDLHSVHHHNIIYSEETILKWYGYEASPSWVSQFACSFLTINTLSFPLPSPDTLLMFEQCENKKAPFYVYQTKYVDICKKVWTRNKILSRQNVFNTINVIFLTVRLTWYPRMSVWGAGPRKGGG